MKAAAIGPIKENIEILRDDSHVNAAGNL